jgi:MYXO-CTERM domain-containing protein
MCEAPTQVVTCTPLDTCHEAGVCDVATGRCSDPIRADDSVCDDGDDCTTGEKCQGGMCVGGSPSCQDGGQSDGGTDGGGEDAGEDAGVEEDAGADGSGHVDGASGDAAGQEDAASGDGGVTQKHKSYLSCSLAAAGNGAATGPLALLLTALGAALGRRRRR